MNIGLEYYGTAEEREAIVDLGVTWTKLTYQGLETTVYPPTLDQWADEVASMGLSAVMDIRTSQEWFQRTIQDHMIAKREHGEAEADKSLMASVDVLLDHAREVVRRHKARIKDWEFWGEYNCPFVAHAQQSTRHAYPWLLGQVSAAIREIDPEARVWNGGAGVNADPTFAGGLHDDNAVQYIDRVNWHHYNWYYLRPPGDDGKPSFTATLDERIAYSIDAFDRGFTEARKYVGDLPYVSSEFGLPVVPDSMANILEAIGLRSFVFDGRVEGLLDSEAGPILEAWMQCFERYGFETIIFHKLLDNPTAPAVDADGNPVDIWWGRYVGLRYPDGTNKSIYDVVRRWGRG